MAFIKIFSNTLKFEGNNPYLFQHDLNTSSACKRIN